MRAHQFEAGGEVIEFSRADLRRTRLRAQQAEHQCAGESIEACHGVSLVDLRRCEAHGGVATLALPAELADMDVVFGMAGGAIW